MEHVFVGFKYAGNEYGPWLREFLGNKPGMRKSVGIQVVCQGNAELRNIPFNAK